MTNGFSPPPAPPAIDGEQMLEWLDGCGERYTLRQAYIDALREFNRVATSHQILLRAGLEGPTLVESWRSYRRHCAACNQAWARYREHLSSHRCQYGVRVSFPCLQTEP